VVGIYHTGRTNAEIDALITAALASPPTAASLALFKFLTQTADRAAWTSQDRGLRPRTLS
jgi:hypothetical protein